MQRPNTRTYAALFSLLFASFPATAYAHDPAGIVQFLLIVFVALPMFVFIVGSALAYLLVRMRRRLRVSFGQWVLSALCAVPITILSSIVPLYAYNTAERAQSSLLMWGAAALLILITLTVQTTVAYQVQKRLGQPKEKGVV